MTETSHAVFAGPIAHLSLDCASGGGGLSRADGMLHRPSQFMMHIYTAHGTGVGWLSRLLGPRREPFATNSNQVLRIAR